MLPYSFKRHGLLCASYPWEVIVFSASLFTFLFTSNVKLLGRYNIIVNNEEYGYEEAFVIFMTIVRCFSVLYVAHQLKKLYASSSYVFVVTTAFVLLSCIVYSCLCIHVLGVLPVDLKNSLFIFLLLFDIKRAGELTQCVLSSPSSSSNEIGESLANALDIFAPGLTLDTAVGILIVGVGTLSHINSLHILSSYACTAFTVNYTMIMTFLPAILSLLVQLNHGQINSAHHIINLPTCKDNPVTQRVKLVMVVVLLCVHILCRFVEAPHRSLLGYRCSTFYQSFHYPFLKWMSQSVERIVVAIVILSLAVKHFFFDDTLGPKENAIVYDEIKNDITLPIRKNNCNLDENNEYSIISPSRPEEHCYNLLKAGNVSSLTEHEILLLLRKKYMRIHQLEDFLQDIDKAVYIRRKAVELQSGHPGVLADLPFRNYEYKRVVGACCENVVGYATIPVGVVGPLLLDGNTFIVPLATTEGCLVASTNRGCAAIRQSGGVKSFVTDKGMTRGPAVRLPTTAQAQTVCNWIYQPAHFNQLKSSFDSTSRFAQLKHIKCKLAGRIIYMRFVANTGDAMGMNMVTKGVEAALRILKITFPELEIISLSANFCSDKKATAINWLEGRGHSVVCEAVISSSALSSILRTSADRLTSLHTYKNLVGSALSGAIGGCNAHAANIVAAIFVATGQDPAQVVSSSFCLTQFEVIENNSLLITCTMPCLEVGTVGGGTILPSQSACLKLLGISGSCHEKPGENASQLARIICATVLAAELSLMAALAEGELVQSHMKHNRSSAVVHELVSFSK